MHLVSLMLIVTFAFVPLVAKAQLPHDFRSEQVLLCPEQFICQSGDTLQLQGIVTCNSSADFKPYSRYVNIEFATRDSVLTRIEAELDSLGRFSTELPIDIDVKDGSYFLRAYTELMRSFSPLNFAFRPITISTDGSTISDYNNHEVFCTILPWGGSLASGTVQHITVRLCNSAGKAVTGKPVKLVNAAGNAIEQANTSSNGLATFSFVPQRGETYSLCLVEGSYDSILGEVHTNDSIAKIECHIKGKKVAFNITNAQLLPPNHRIFGYDNINGITEVSTTNTQGAFALQRSPSLFTVFLTDSLLNVLSQCSAINPGDISCQLSAPGIASVGDTITFNISHLPDDAVTIARLMPKPTTPIADAFSELTLASQLSSPIPLPTLGTGDNSLTNDIAAWLGTASFSRFVLRDAIRLDSAIYTHLPKMQMNLNGIASQKSGLSLKDGSLVVYNTETNVVADTKLFKNGNFDIVLDNFYGNTRFYFQTFDMKGKPVGTTFQFPDKKYPAMLVPHHFNFDSRQAAMPHHSNALQLPEMTVKAMVKQTNNLPSTEVYGTRYKSREEIERHNYLTLREVLKKIPGIIVTKEGIRTTRGASTLYDDPYVTLMIDNTLFSGGADFEALLEMPTSEIESVEYMQPWKALSYTWRAICGLVLVKTRNSHIKPIESRGSFITLQGLAPTLPQPALVARSASQHTLVVDVISKEGICTLYQDININP